MVTQTIRVNLNQKDLETIQAVQSDTLREIAFKFYATDAEDAVQLDPDEYTVKFNVLKPDNNFVMTTFTDGVIKLSDQITAVTGTGYYCILLMQDDELIYSGNGKIIINDHVIGTENIDSVSEADGYTFPDDFYTKDTPLAVLDDSTTSTTSTWSSEKINSVVQSAAQIADNVISTNSTWSSNKINGEIDSILQMIDAGKVECNNDGYINIYNSVVSTTDWSYSDYIDVSDYMSIYYTITTHQSVASIMGYDESKTVPTILLTRESGQRGEHLDTGSLDIPDTIKYIRVTFRNGADNRCFLAQSIETLMEEINALTIKSIGEICTINGYIRASNDQVEDSDHNWSHSDYLPVYEGLPINYALSGHSVVGSIMLYDSAKTKVGYVGGFPSGQITTGTYIVEKNVTYVRITIFNSDIANEYVTGVNDPITVNYYKNASKENYVKNDITNVINKSESSFCGALNKTFELLNSKFPTAKIVICTPVKCGHYNEGGSQGTIWSAYNSKGLTMVSYVEKIKQAAALYSLPVIDLFSESGMNPTIQSQIDEYWNESETDNFHPGQNGHQQMANVIKGWLNSNLPLSGSWSGKSGLVIGDSITYGLKTSKTYWSYLEDWLGIDFTSNAYAGTGYTAYTPTNNPFYSRINSITGNYDIIILMGGVNDFAFTPAPFGSLYSAES